MNQLDPEGLALRRLGGGSSAVVDTGLAIFRGFRKRVRRVSSVPNLVERKNETPC
jgi:hypothetical protein